jgi:xylitol oxidase
MEPLDSLETLGGHTCFVSSSKDPGNSSSSAVREKNWAGNLTYQAESVLTPGNIGELQEMVKTAEVVKALGSRHSFNRIADTTGTQISLKHLDRIQDVDRESHTVTIEAGVTYGQLAPVLEAQGYALPNLASLPHISVAGAVATGTHGSGANNGNLSTSVLSADLVDEDGTLVTIDASDENFVGTIVHLGALGVVASLTLEVIPSFEIAQSVFLDLPFDTGLTHFDEIMGCAYSVSLFTDWNEPTFSQVWVKSQGGTPEFPWAPAAKSPQHPIAGVDPINCTEQGGVPGKWLDRLPHFKMGFTPSSGLELQTEYMVPRSSAAAALQKLAELRPLIAPLLLISEVRTMAGDDLWLSPAYGRDTVAIHFTWKQDQEAVEDLLPTLESALAPFQVRPHWGKLFSMDARKLKAVYPRFDDFLELAAFLSPGRKFRNEFLEQAIFAGSLPG